MAHLSDFSQQRQAETERLLSELVSATLGGKVSQTPATLKIYYLHLIKPRLMRDTFATSHLIRLGVCRMYATRCELVMGFMQPGEDTHEAGFEWGLASLAWHQYPDVNPSSVNAHYEG